MTRQAMLSLLYDGISRTMGCTDIGAVGFAAAKAGSLLNGRLVRIDLKLSDMLYKNSLRVGIPGTGKAGLQQAVLLGYILKNPEKKLSVFEEAGEDDLKALVEIEEHVKFSVSYESKDDPLYINLTSFSDDSEVCVQLLSDYDNIDSIYIDNKLVYKNKDHSQIFRPELSKLLTIDDIYEFVLTENEAFDQLIEFAEINFQTARINLKEVDSVLAETSAEDVIMASHVVQKFVYNAVILRMSGEAVPVMGVAGSGNLGLAVLMAPYLLGTIWKSEPAQMKKAIALSVLISTYIKRKMTLLTTICGSALAGGAAISAVAVFLQGGTLEEIKNAINMQIAVNAGTFCDGAKESCAFKVAFSAANGVLTGKMALEGEKISSENGINKAFVEETIDNIAEINNKALDSAKDKILEII